LRFLGLFKRRFVMDEEREMERREDKEKMKIEKKQENQKEKKIEPEEEIFFFLEEMRERFRIS
jgi:hypothetical protein